MQPDCVWPCLIDLPVVIHLLLLSRTSSFQRLFFLFRFVVFFSGPEQDTSLITEDNDPLVASHELASDFPTDDDEILSTASFSSLPGTVPHSSLSRHSVHFVLNNFSLLSVLDRTSPSHPCSERTLLSFGSCCGWFLVLASFFSCLDCFPSSSFLSASSLVIAFVISLSIFLAPSSDAVFHCMLFSFFFSVAGSTSRP